MARGRPKKTVENTDRFEIGREYDTLEHADERFEGPGFSEEEIRKNLQMGCRDPLWIDNRHRPADKVYEWGTETILGMSDHSGLVDRARTGWTPVPISRHPECMVDPRIDGGESRKAGIIRRKGAILFERSKHLHDIAVKISEEENLRALDLVRHLEKSNGLIPIGMGSTHIKSNKISMSREKSFN